MKKRKNQKESVPADSKKAANQRNLRRLGILFINFVLFYAIFRLILEISERTQIIGIYYALTIVYAAATAGLFIAYFILNGFSFEKAPRGWDDLPPQWTDEQKKRFLAEQPAKKEKAKMFLYILLPLVITLLISYIELNFFG